MREELRAGDVCGRVGGDEFMLAIVDADLGLKPSGLDGHALAATLS